MKTPHLIVIAGPTASGKTSFSIKLAQLFNTQILSADSRQLYRELSIGVARPSEEELSAVPHHFIASHSLHQNVSAGSYAGEAYDLIHKLGEKHQVLILCGGSGLYIRALLEGFDAIPEVNPAIRSDLNALYKSEGLAPLLEELKQVDPDFFESVDRHNPQRIIRALEVYRSSGTAFSWYRNQKAKGNRFASTLLLPKIDDAELKQRIRERTLHMWEQGLQQEAEGLLPYAEHPALKTVGYQEVFAALKGEYPMVEVPERIIRNTWQYARRQKTWFRNQGDYEPTDFDQAILCHQTVKEKLSI